MNLTLSDLRYFVTVAAVGNMTRAAKILGTSQPSVSGALRRLEQEMGVPLLLRSKTGVRVTKAGALFQSRAKELIAQWQEVGRDTRERHDDVTAKYSLGCHPALGLYALPSFLPQLFASYPQLDIELTHGSSREIADAVIDFRLDFGIVADPRPHPDLVIRRLGTDTVCFARATKGKAPSSLRELRETVLICDPSIYQTQRLLKALAKKKIAFRRNLYCTRLDVVAALVHAGAGIGILPLRSAGRISVGPFVPLETLPRLKNTICLVYRMETQASPAARQIAKEIEAHGKWE